MFQKGGSGEPVSDATKIAGKVPSVCWINNEEIIEESQWELGGYLDVTFYYYFSLNSLVSHEK